MIVLLVVLTVTCVERPVLIITYITDIHDRDIHIDIITHT